MQNYCFVQEDQAHECHLHVHTTLVATRAHIRSFETANADVSAIYRVPADLDVDGLNELVEAAASREVAVSAVAERGSRVLQPIR